jgi:putative nucleotidyltransferase with HDIG domain
MSVPPVADLSAADRLEAGLSGAADLPLLPSTAQQALQLTRERDVSLAEFARLIESDVALASTILKLANSPLYSWGRTIATLEQAVVRLGLHECESLVIAVGMKSLAGRAPAAVKSRCAWLWQHSFVVGCLCRKMNRELSFGHAGEEFTAGLLHDLGRVVIALLVPDAFPAADPMTFDESEDVLARERQVVGYEHCAIGARFAEQSRMPRDVIGAIRHHHDPSGAGMARGLVELVAAADHLANHFQRGAAAEEYDLSANASFAWLAQALDPHLVDYFAARIPSLLKEASRALKGSGLGV